MEDFNFHSTLSSHLIFQTTVENIHPCGTLSAQLTTIKVSQSSSLSLYQAYNKEELGGN